MHIYVAGLGGAGLGPLAEMAHGLGNRISGSDVKDSDALEAMRTWQPVPHINIGQTAKQIAAVHARRQIDWYVYSSALEWVEPPNEELAWVRKQGIRHSKRDEFLNYLLKASRLQLLALSGSHGKTTSTALMIWLCRQLGEEVSYAFGGRFADWPAARLTDHSRWFVYEADEFDHNFLAFRPKLSLITGLDYDHPETFPTRRHYRNAFWQFIAQSEQTIIGQHDLENLGQPPAGLDHEVTAITSRPADKRLTLAGAVNRENASLVLAGAKIINPDADEDEMINILNRFPGCWRRFEEIAPNVYTDYAHNPIKVAGCLQRGQELGKPLVIVYEPHSNQRQHIAKEHYKHLFKGVAKVYWLPTYLVREDPDLKVLSAEELVACLADPGIAEVADMDEELKTKLKEHLASGAAVIGMSAGPLDAWLRQNLSKPKFLKF